MTDLLYFDHDTDLRDEVERGLTTHFDDDQIELRRTRDSVHGHRVEVALDDSLEEIYYDFLKTEGWAHLSLNMGLAAKIG